MVIYNLRGYSALFDNMLKDTKLFRNTSRNKEGVVIAQYSYRNLLSIIQDRTLLYRFKIVEKALGIQDKVLSRFITVFENDDFLNGTNHVHMVSISKYLSVFPDGGNIIINGEKIPVPPYCAIEMSTEDVYSIEPSPLGTTVITWLIPHYETLELFKIFSTS